MASKPKLRLIVPLLAFLCLWAVRAYPKDAPVNGFFLSDAPVEISADNITFDKSTGTYHAKGNVVVVQNGTILKSEEVVLNSNAGVATAYGTVMAVDKEGNTLTGENLQMNLKEKTAVITHARIFYREDNLHIDSDVIKKTGERSFETESTTYTTCDCKDPKESPAWSFRTSSASVTVGQFLTGWNAKFYIKGLPVLYVPYISVPVKRQRQSGLLQPRFGYSKLRGFAVENSVFWAITPSTDATFYLDVETNRGVGEGAEYRYYRTRESHGEIFLFRFKERDINRVRSFRAGVDNLSRPADASNTRWQFKLDHTELLPAGAVFKANLNLLSDDEYLLDFARKGDDRTLESIENNVSISKNWGSYSLVAQFRYFNNLLDNGDRTTLQKLPEITFSNTDKLIPHTPFYVSSDSSFVYFTRKEGVTGQRLDVKPTLSLPLRPGGLFDLTTSFSPRATLYMLANDPNHHYTDRYLYEINVDAASTFVRYFHPGPGGAEAYRNTIRPRLVYTYIPQADQGDLPQFDAVDNVTAQNTLTYSLTTVLTGKWGGATQPEYRDVAFFEVEQSYDINEGTRKVAPGEAKRRPMSDVRAELRLNPATWLNFAALGEYSIYDHWFNTYNTSVSAHDKRGDTLDVSYRFIRSEATRYLEARGRLHVMRPVDLTYLKRYSFDDGHSLETSYALEYKHQCWSATLTYSERLAEKIVYLNFDLRGLGRVAGIEGKIEPM